MGEFVEIRGAARDLDRWQAELDGGMAPFLQVAPVRDPARFSGFEGRFRRNLIGQVSMQLTEVETTQHSLARTDEHISLTPEPHYFVLAQLSGASTFHQGDSSSRLEAGDYAICDTKVPYQWDFDDGGHSVFSLRFPQTLLDIPAQAIRPITGKALRADGPFGKHLSPFLAAVAQDEELLRGPVSGRVARNLIDMFAIGVAELLHEAPGGFSAPLFFQVTEYIGAHLADAELDASQVAAGCHISVRYLQAIFRDQGTTVTDWIRERRLAGCCRDLSNPALREVSIGEIARRWGYPDAAYFARLFRRSFGETPREWRARALLLLAPADAQTELAPLAPLANSPSPAAPPLARLPI